jgi:hypothetical protein
MLFLTLKTVFLSLLLIALIHYLYGFFKNTLTVPKVKDLVNKPAQRYNQMFAAINNENDYTQQQNVRQERNVGQERNVEERNVGQQSMQAELKNFLNELKKPNIVPQISSPNAQTIDSINNNFSAANESAFGSYTPF